MDELELVILQLVSDITNLENNVNLNRALIVGLWTLEKFLIVWAFNKIFRINKK